MKRGIIALLSVALAFGQNAKQRPPAAPPEDVSRITVDVTRANLLYTVTDKKGRFVSNLTKEDFEIIENKKKQNILEFTAETDLPLRLAILIDTSNSIRERFRFIQEAATNFITTVMRPGKDKAIVVSFDTSPQLVADLTDDQVAVTKAIRELRPGGGTALYDALYKTCRDQMLNLPEPGSVRRALILVSDGDDNYSRAQESDAIKMCQRANTIVYAISTNVSPSRDKGDDVLKDISEATGGQAFYPVKIEDVALGFRKIEQELRSQYSLVYRPADFRQDGSFRTIYLQALDPRYHVRAQKGYFAPRPPQ